MQEFDRALTGLSYEDKKEILGDYEEHFRFGLAAGKTEEEICEALGQPKAIAKAYRAETLVARAKSDKSVGNIMRALIAVVSLGFFNLVFVSGIFFGLAGTLIGFWGAGIGITFGGLAVLIVSLIGPALLIADMPAAAMAGMGFLGAGLCALGILWGIGCFYISKWFYKLIVKYLQFNIKIIKGYRV